MRAIHRGRRDQTWEGLLDPPWEPAKKNSFKIGTEVCRLHRTATDRLVPEPWMSGEAAWENKAQGCRPNSMAMDSMSHLLRRAQREGPSCICSSSLAASLSCSPEHLWGKEENPEATYPGPLPSPKGHGWALTTGILLMRWRVCQVFFGDEHLNTLGNIGPHF